MELSALSFLTFIMALILNSHMTSIPERIQKTATIWVQAPVQAAFPLFGPVREKEWAYGWDPQIVYGTSEAELHMIFETSGAEGTYTWVITQFEPSNFLVEYTVSTADRIWFITVQCKDRGKKTEVEVTYTYTGLSARGNELNRKAMDKMFAQNLKDWEAALDYYLSTGKQLQN